MPAPQQIPPGALDLHVALVALTPALLAFAAGAAVAILGGSRAARVLGWSAMLAALALLALGLRPDGVANAYAHAIGRGVMRVGWWQLAAALAAGAVAALSWRPGRERGGLGWGARTAVAMVAPITVVGWVLLLAEPDHRREWPWSPGGWARRWRPLAIVLLGAVGVGIGLTDDGDRWFARAAMAGAALACATGAPHWRLPALLAAAAALAPLPDA